MQMLGRDLYYQSNHTLKQKLIWIVDDSLDHCFILKHSLSRLSLSVQVECFNRGEELLSQLESNLENESHNQLPDLIFLDLQMPGIGGLETLKKVKEDEYLTDIPTVIISSNVNCNVKEELYDHGARHILDKTYVLENLSDLLTEIIENDWSE